MATLRLVVTAGVLASVAAAAVDARSARANSKKPRVIAGKEVSCKDMRGRDVHVREVANLGDVGRARMVRGMPIIVLDTTEMRRLPPKLQLFFYTHECAHHVLGHWYAPARGNEAAADCWAVRFGRDKGYFTRFDVVSFAPWFAASKGSRYGHLPGPVRARFLVDCFDSEEIASTR